MDIDCKQITLGVAIGLLLMLAMPALSAVPNGTTTVTFEFPSGTPVTSVGLGAGTDVYVRTYTTSAAEPGQVDNGKVQLEIATDGAAGGCHPTTVAGVVEWVRIDPGDGGTSPVGGYVVFPVNLNELATLPVTCTGGVALQNVTCSNTTVGFRAHYITGGGAHKVDTHFSDPASLGITCVSGCTTCCTYTQGFWGGPESAAANPIIDALITAGSSPFTGDPNATTIGTHLGGNSVTIDDAATLKAYLPAGGTPAPLGATGHAHYPPITAPTTLTPSGSNGSEGGTLSGQAMSMGLNLFLSGKLGYPADLANVTVPSSGMLCTKRGTVCEAFSFPSCSWGKKVSQILAGANNVLGTGTASLCVASDSADALDKLNKAFDACGEIIACGAVASPGVFTCP